MVFLLIFLILAGILCSIGAGIGLGFGNYALFGLFLLLTCGCFGFVRAYFYFEDQKRILNAKKAVVYKAIHDPFKA